MPDPLSHDDRAASFEQGADVYAATRPPYPDEAVDWLLPDNAGTVLDLAAGTGKLTSALVARGLTVHAVEPSQAMLGHLQAALPGVHAHVGAVESATFRWRHRLPTSALRPLAASRSYLIARPADRREELLAEVDALVATHPDLAGRDETELPYVAECYRADVAL